MKAYQEKYIENLKLVMELSEAPAGIPEDIPRFIRERRQKNDRIREIIAENTDLLRKNLMPLLDDIISASPEEVQDLEDFASHLLRGAKQLDLVLNYMVRCALVAYARKQQLTDMLICQLYHTGMALFYMQQTIQIADKNNYRWKMNMAFGEAAAYIKKYDEIENPETRGYIHRSMANLALGYRWDIQEEAEQKKRVLKRSFQILNDPVYHEKTPSLPWDAFIYKSHQERTTAMQLLRRKEADPGTVREVMESAEYVWKKQMETSFKRGVRPAARWVLEYDIAQYHCGILTLAQLLQNMERVFMDLDRGDYSEDGLWGHLMLPAFYAEYMRMEPSMIPRKKTVLLFMYGQMIDYVQHVPNTQLNSLLNNHLLAGFQAFVEYPDGIRAKDFLINLIVCRDPDIYVHLQLTADAAQILMEEALERMPLQLAGVLSYQTAEEVLQNRRRILEFTEECALTHDIGLFLFDSLVTLRARMPFKEEEIMYEYHADAGARVLSRCESTRIYAPAALGHHRFYDGRGGYSGEYLREEDPNRQVTDIISIASHLVSLMDAKFNEQREELSFEEAFDRVLQQAGTRFSPEFCSLLPQLFKKLRACMQTAPELAYEKAFERLRGREGAK